MAGEFKYSGAAVMNFIMPYRAAIGGCVAGQGDLMCGAAALIVRANGLSTRAFNERLIQMYINNETTFAVGVAASALGNLRDNRAFQPLLTAMQGDSDLNVREHAATALGMTGDSHAFQPLLETLQGNRNVRIRAHAVYGLGFLQDERVLPILLDALRDKSADVRAHAAMALGETRDSRALEALSAALNDPSGDVRRHAAESIEKIQGQQREN